MALVRAKRSFVIQGYEKVKKRFSNRGEYIEKPILYLTWQEAICDESEADSIIENMMKQQLEDANERNDNLRISYRKYCRPAEFEEYPAGKEFELEIQYIRDWKMEKIIKKLRGSEFAILCKELGISAGEALSKN